MSVKISWNVELQNKIPNILQHHYVSYFCNRSITCTFVLLTCTTEVFISKAWLAFSGISGSFSRCSFTKQQYQHVNAASSLAQTSKIKGGVLCGFLFISSKQLDFCAIFIIIRHYSFMYSSLGLGFVLSRCKEYLIFWYLV